MDSSRNRSEAYKALIDLLAAEAVDRFLEEGPDFMTKPKHFEESGLNCDEKHFCQRCGRELNMVQLVPNSPELSCPGCEWKKPRKVLV